MEEQKADHQIVRQRPQRSWVDITKECQTASKELNVGELLRDDMFTLFEAMSAIEMMDPKMDAGMMCNRVSRPVLSFKESIDAGVVKVKDLSLRETIAIIDDTTCCFMAWLDGHSLAQTVLTNLYLHDPLLIEDKCIRSFSLLTLKLVDICQKLICQAEVFEEEDFQNSLYNYNYDYGFPVSKICSLVKEVEDELIKRTKSLQREVPSHNKLASVVSNGFEEGRELMLIQGLHGRLKFFRCFLSSLLTISKEINNASKEDLKAKTSLNGTFFPVAEISKYLTSCLESFSFWSKTCDQGIKPKESTPTATPSTEDRIDYPTIPGFEPLVNQRLLPPTFPRYTKLKSRIECITQMEDLIHHLILSLKIRDVACYHRALDFFSDFSRFHGGHCVLSRSVLQLIYVPSTTKKEEFMEKLRGAIVNFIRPPVLILLKSSIMVNGAKQAVESFVTQSLRPAMTLLQINGHNRARQRDRIGVVLEELSLLQTEAENLDHFLHRLTSNFDPPTSHIGYFSTWVLYHLLRSMIQFVLLGFELELYSPHEYPYVFWYLADFLYGWLISTLTRAASLSQEARTFGENISKTRNSKKIRNKKKTKDKPHEKEILLAQGMHHLTGGLFKTVIAFKLEGRLKEPKAGISSERTRYEHRFLPFASIPTPPNVPYDQYEDVIRQHRHILAGQPPKDVYASATKSFDEARRCLELIPEPNEDIVSCLKVARTNIVVTKLLVTNIQRSKSFPEFDFTTNKNFPIIRVL